MVAFSQEGILTLERIKRRVTKLVIQFKNLSYEERLAKLNLTTLEKRRNRDDLIHFFKFYSNINIIDWYKEVKINGNSRPRKNSNQHSLIDPLQPYAHREKTSLHTTPVLYY